ncbi:MAG: hypothetical protein U5K33_06440 [Halofilum sp. (in: g-proteobacteria)]|nr:hypothetical protein [Halofilum sp. (in: g-proteobacteria)]
MRISSRAAWLSTALAIFTAPALATPAFDFDDGPITGSAGALNSSNAAESSIDFTNGLGDMVSVTAGYSTNNLCCQGTLDPASNVEDADVVWKNDPAGHGGLGVLSVDDDDTIDGSNSGVAADEVLFFDFGTMRDLVSIILNGAHEETLASGGAGGSEKWGLWTSGDGSAWTPFTGANNVDGDGNLYAQDDDETLLLDVSTRWLALSAVGPTGQTGGYVERVEYQVPGPGVLGLMALGLLAMAGAYRRR